MKKKTFAFGLVALLIVIPSCAYAQLNSKKPIKELPCGCLINDIDRKCGICGGFLKSQLMSMKAIGRNHYTFDYICNCGHKHTALSDEYNYGHVCNKQRCLQNSITQDAEGNRTLHIKNVCPKETPFIVWILPRSRHLRSLIVPGGEWIPNIKFTKEEKIQIEIDTRPQR